jgi:glycosyltransferase involved in cell wall biosynthesis
MTDELTIIIPVYNEEKNIVKAIPLIESKVKVPHSYIVVYDFPEDSTVPAVHILQKKYKKLKLFKNEINNGRGVINAIKTGFKRAKSSCLVVMMADLADDPQTVNMMYEKITQGYDVVCASRYSKGGKHLGGPFLKSFLSWLADITAPFILGIPTYDLTNAFKMYRKKVIDSIDIQSQGGFELSMEIVLKAYFKNFKITEVPTVWKDRSEGTSRFNLAGWLPRYLHWYTWGLKKRFGLE